MRVQKRAWREALKALPALLVIAACTTAYQDGVDDPNYGAPGSLKRPEASGDASTSSPPPTCATPVMPEGGTCSVSFKQILEGFRAASCTTSSCHGSPTTPPQMKPDDPAATYATFSAYVLSGTTQPYIDPCTTDPTKSGMACNLKNPGGCGNPMPQGAPGTYDPGKISEIETWLACGAPNN